MMVVLKLYRGLSACMRDSLLAKTDGLSPRIGGLNMVQLYLSRVGYFKS